MRTYIPHTMKKILWVLLGGISLLYACAPKNGYEITGELIGAKAGDKVFLEKIAGQMTILDSMELTDNGRFKFLGNVPDRGVYRLIFNNEAAVDLVLDNESSVKVTVDKAKTLSDYKIEGSEASESIKKVNTILINTYNEINNLQAEMVRNQASPDIQEISKKLEARYMEVIGKQVNDIKSFISESKDPIVAVYALSYLNMDENITYIESILDKYPAEAQQSEYIRLYINKFNDYRKLAVGQPAPELNLPDPTGKMVSLSSLKGQVVLIDFWASWCGPCRQENPNVVKLYNAYKGKGFQIYGVSLDKTKEAWTKAIMDDKLTWIHVSDLQYWNSAAAALYKVDAIPATVLIDRDGKIVAKNLRGEELEEFLKKLFSEA